MQGAIARSPSHIALPRLPRVAGSTPTNRFQTQPNRSMNQNHNFKRLTICFALFSVIAAGLIGLGQESWKLPILVAIASSTAILLTDRLGLLELHRYLVYTLMIGGALWAIWGFLGDATANRLLSVGNLLVYVQLPLMFQKKSKRVFEQWGVFMLLELVVAALVNDTVLYGVLMLPVLILGSAALMALAIFASHLRHSESVSESTGLWSRMLHWLGIETMVTRRSSGVSLSASRDDAAEANDRNYAPSRWRIGILPMALATLLFSVAYFYMLPRLHSGVFERDGFSWGGAKIGFNSQVSLQYIGEVLQNDSPAFRLSMLNAKTGANYRPNQPPYIRATVVERYIDGAGQGFWQPYDRGALRGGLYGIQELPNSQELDSDLLSTRDSVAVTIIEKSPFGEVVCGLPPLAQMEKSAFRVGRRDWRLADPRPNAHSETPGKRRYSFLTYAFANGQDSPVLTDLADSYEDKQAGSFNVEYRRELLQFAPELRSLEPEIKRILGTSAEPLNSKLSQALFLEDYLANSNDYTYSLSLTGPKNRSIDPIVDFMLNKKRGHCQYFASSLALILRSLKIPTRLVVGFRPSEYNDVGGYFPVLQNHAHVWVEAYFTLDEIAQSDALVRDSVAVPPWASKGVWLRLDPTPPVDGSNAGGSFRVSRLQTLDAIEDLWTEMVMNMDKSKQGSLFSLFAESSGGSYANLWLQVQNILSRMQSSRFIGGLLSPEKWFSWRIALSVFALGAAWIFITRFFPHWLPPWLSRLYQRRSQGRNAVSRVDFYEQAVRLLQRLGVRRMPHQTQREYLANASAQLHAIGIQLNDRDLSDAFYDKRFGGRETLSEEQRERIGLALSQIEAALRDGAKRKLRTP